MKLKIYSAIAAAALLCSGAVVLITKTGPNLARLSGEDTSYTLSINNTQRLDADGSIHVNTTANNPITFTATGVTASSEDYIVALTSGGTLVNSTPISGIGTITVTFDRENDSDTLSLSGLAHPGQENGKTAICALESGVETPLTRTWDGIELKATGKISIKDIQIHYSCASRFETENPVRYEAEYSFHKFQSWNYGEGTPSFFHNDSGASNGVYLGDIWDWVQQDGSLFFDHYAFRSGEYKIRTHYRTDDANRGMRLKVNGTDYSFTWGNAPGWGDWADRDVPVILNEGWNRIEFSLIQSNWVHLDYFEVRSDVTNYIDPTEMIESTVFYTEAENTNLWSTATSTFRTYDSNVFSMNVGCGFGDADGNGFEINTFAMQAGEYQFKAGVLNAGSDIEAILYVNSQPAEGTIVTVPGASTLQEVTICNVTLQEGTNRLSFGRHGTWCNFDYFRLVPVE